MNATGDFLIRILSPVHMGCDEVYEPLEFVLDEEAKTLTSFDPLDFFSSLDRKDRDSFATACAKGTLESLLELLKFMRGRKSRGHKVDVSGGLVEDYRRTLGIRAGDQRRIQQELNSFQIQRTAFDPHTNHPYIPGSAVKGALRTAWLNAKQKEKNLRPGRNNRDVERELLDGGNLETDPFRLLKVSDFHPVGSVRAHILFAVNEKKIPSKFKARGPYQIVEIIPSGSVFAGRVDLLDPPAGSLIKTPLEKSKLLKSAGHFYGGEFGRENKELEAIGVFGRTETPASGVLLRIGRHSGAESVTIEGHRNIRIKKGRGEKDGNLDHATTLWLASDASRNYVKERLQPFGWVALEETSRAALNELRECLRSRAETITPVPAAEESPAEERKPATPAAPVIETWDDMNLSWNPGNQVITASSGARKATGRGRELLPASLQERLIVKRKPARARVTVEKTGNAFTIRKIET